MVGHKEMANAIRFLSMDAVQKANSGHPGMPMGMADVATVLFSKFMKFDPKAPHWIDRDRFVLSAGHGSMLLYSLLYLTGYSNVDIKDLENFRQLGSPTAGHPEYGHLDGIDATAGPLGQGIGMAVGMALAEKLLNERFGGEFCDHYTYVINGDGCLMEGISEEAISFAGHLGLNKLVLLWDDNDITIDGSTGVSTSTDQLARFKANGWDTFKCDGHKPDEIEKAIEKARMSPKPAIVACKTVIGYGAPNKQGTHTVHGSPLGDEEIAAARKELGWEHKPFDIPEDILGTWRKVGEPGTKIHKDWLTTIHNMDGDNKQTLLDVIESRYNEDWKDALANAKKEWLESKPKVATRKASQMVLEEIMPHMPHVLGGSADLTGSNLTKTTKMKSVTPDDFTGNYMHYGIREHGMAAIMNGVALHKGFIPYGGTFLIFSDYLRPGMRMSALMNQRVIYVLTHDSIGLGEDGPTHQPVEHMAAMRAMPNVLSFRPCDIIETAECWELALENASGPSALALSRQGLPVLRNDASENKSAKGAYVLAEANGERKVTLIATGSEVELAMNAREQLQKDGIATAVVSMPCTELFDKQDKAYKTDVLGKTALRISIEALTTYGWDRYVGLEGEMVGMHGFGASGPAPELYKHFNITAEAVVKVAKQRM